MFELAPVSVLLLLLLLLTLVPVADAVAAVPVPVGVLDGVIVDAKSLADEVGDAAPEIADVDEEEAESSLIMKAELWNGSLKSRSLQM